MRNRILAAMSLLAVMTLALPAFGNGDGSGWGDMPIDTTTTTTVPPTTTTTLPPTSTTTTLSTNTGTRATPTTTSTTVAPPPPPELPDPSALAELNCEAGVVVVTLTNDGEAPAVFDGLV